VEDGEECDCGFSSDCKESCCNDASKPNACKLTVGSECSPSQGPCCQSDCSYSPKNSQICSSETECLKNVYCNGDAAYCPRNDSIYFINFDKDGTLKDCNDGTQVCHNGVCSGSICEKSGLQQCYLKGDLKDKNVNKEILCHVACIGEATNNVCTDTFEIETLVNRKRNSSGFILKPGSACSGTHGYCDIFSKCRAVDAEGPLSRLKKLLLNPKTLTDIQTWIIVSLF
jgi:disintegrin and metalloproteinase domain-containing protein 10